VRLNGVIAQMGERLNGIQEVGSSILPGSTNTSDGSKRPTARWAFCIKRFQFAVGVGDLRDVAMMPWVIRGWVCCSDGVRVLR
jgi:hypothetical protein